MDVDEYCTNDRTHPKTESRARKLQGSGFGTYSLMSLRAIGVDLALAHDRLPVGDLLVL